MISAFFAEAGYDATMEDFDEGMVRLTILSTLRNIRRKFKSEYGEIVLCCDTGRSWRKEAFPYYKASRKKTQEQSKIDWKVLKETFSKILDEIEEHFHFKVMRVKFAEADDIIASLAMRYGAEIGDGSEKIMVVSSDKDFIQLQEYSNVDQWCSLKGFVRHSNPALFLKELIVSGDRIDGIPNALSEDDCFVVGKRQTVLTAKRKEALIEGMTTGIFPNEFPDAKKRITRNTILISFAKIPAHLHKAIHDEYDRPREAPKGRLFDYFFKHRLRALIEDIKEFK